MEEIWVEMEEFVIIKTYKNCIGLMIPCYGWVKMSVYYIYEGFLDIDSNALTVFYIQAFKIMNKFGTSDKYVNIVGFFLIILLRMLCNNCDLLV